VDYVDVCTLPNYRLPAVELCAQSRKHVLVRNPWPSTCRQHSR
jgi:hypothetical protein